jgi:CheY-like chemotaxis protein
VTKKILIVEDHAEIREILGRLLKQRGYDVIDAEDGAQGLAVLAEEAIDLVLLDLNLPDGDGLSIAQQIRAKSTVPIIILTARNAQEDKLIGLGLGADDYLTKPINPHELYLRVRNLLDRAGKAAEAAPPQAPLPPVDGATQRSSPTPKARGGFTAVGAALTVLGLIVAVGGVTWWALDRPPDGAKTATTAEGPAQSEAKMATTAEDPALLRKDEDARPLPEVQSDLPIAATSFAWVLQSKCGDVPYVSWWKVRTRADIVGYVNRRYAGNWKPYIDDWTARLIDIQESYARGQAVRIPDGAVLSGEALKVHVDKTKQRVDVILCLSREAAEYAHKKIPR